jgi:hypothetical protein
MEQSEWKKLTVCNTGYEADMLVALLDEAGIPTLVQGPPAGVYGYGFGGPTPQGITIKVPADRLEEAKGILEEQLPI